MRKQETNMSLHFALEEQDSRGQPTGQGNDGGSFPPNAQVSRGATRRCLSKKSQFQTQLSFCA